MNLLSHLMQDFFLKAELDAVLRLFWPLPNPEHIMALKPFVHARVRYLTGRHAVSRFLWTANCRGGAQISHALEHAFLVRAWNTVHTTIDDRAEGLLAYA